MSAVHRLRAVVLESFAIALALTLGHGQARAEVAPATATVAVNLYHPTDVALAEGESIVVRGEVVTRHDGVRYDAAARYGEDGTRVGGLLVTTGTGLRVARRERGLVELESTGEDAPICRALGLTAPCLVPRTVALAHERLLTADEFLGTVSGSLFFEPKAPPAIAPRVVRTLALAFGFGALLVSLAVSLIWLARRRQRPLARVRRAVRHARRGVRGSASEATLNAQIEGLMRSAEALANAERAATDRLAASRRAEVATTSVFGAREASELDRLRAQRDRSRHGLSEIEAALRVLALQDLTDEHTLSETDRALARLDEELSIAKEAEAEAAATAHSTAT